PAAGSVPPRRQQDDARSSFASKDPLRRRHARLGQGRRHRQRETAARTKELKRHSMLDLTRYAHSTDGPVRAQSFEKPTSLAKKDLPMPLFRFLAHALVALALCGAPGIASAQSVSDGTRGRRSKT